MFDIIAISFIFSSSTEALTIKPFAPVAYRVA